MKLIVLAENTACRADMVPQHGLSLYVETGEMKLLFDMGQTDAFARNAETLGVDLSQVDFAVLSHGHYDHGGGLPEFLKINRKAHVYIHENAFGAYYNGKEKYIGLDTSLRDDPQLIFTKGNMQLAPGVKLADCNDLGWCSNNWGLNRREGDAFFPDPFHHEQYLEIIEGEKRILVSGCSHKGILNITRHFRPDVLIGGFHLNKLEDPAMLQEIARKLLAGNTVYYTGHCTGSRQFDIMKQIMGDRLQSISTGAYIEM